MSQEGAIFMSSVSQIEMHLGSLFGERANTLARETGCIKRQRVFDGASLARTFVFGWMENERTTLERLTQIAQYSKVAVSDTAIDKRFTEQGAIFLQRLLEETVQCVVQEAPVDHRLLRRFGAVVLEDSSQVTLPNGLAGIWRGSGGSPGTSNASVKLHVRLDLLTGQLQGPVLTDGRASDNKSPLSIEALPEKSLYLADVGYFSFTRLQALDASARFFVQRLKGGTGVYNKKGHQLVLKGLLPRHEGEWVSYGVLLGATARLAVRLMIVKVPQAVGEQRRKDLLEEARRKGEAVSQEQLDLADWTILVSNVAAKRLSVPEALVLMRLRWQIERLFHRWKDGSQIDEWRTSKPWRILCELYSKLISDVIVQWVSVAGCWQDLYRSLDKAAQAVRKEALSFLKAFHRPGDLRRTLEWLRQVMQSGCRTTSHGGRVSAARLLEQGSDWQLKSWVLWQQEEEQTSCCAHSS
jgi:Transposase DDE domain